MQEARYQVRRSHLGQLLTPESTTSLQHLSLLLLLSELESSNLVAPGQIIESVFLDSITLAVLMATLVNIELALHLRTAG